MQPLEVAPFVVVSVRHNETAKRVHPVPRLVEGVAPEREGCAVDILLDSVQDAGGRRDLSQVLVMANRGGLLSCDSPGDNVPRIRADIKGNSFAYEGLQRQQLLRSGR